jgi:hypothetical protein
LQRRAAEPDAASAGTVNLDKGRGCCHDGGRVAPGPVTQAVTSQPDRRDLSDVAAEILGARWVLRGSHFGNTVASLTGLGLRDNPLRPQLIVSRVLAKHIPVAPTRALDVAGQLASRVLSRLDRDGASGDGALVVGFCETATGLGQTVAAALVGRGCAADYLHTTRRATAVPAVLSLQEEHSHATTHLLAPHDVGLLSRSRPLVLVDDELTTGRTALNAIEVIHRRWPRSAYVLACIADVRDADARSVFEDRAAELGTSVVVVSLLSATLAIAPDAVARARRARGRLLARQAPARHDGPAVDQVIDAGWPATLPLGGRHGLLHGMHPDYDRATDSLATATYAAIRASNPGHPGARVLVVGHEELIGLPLRLAERLQRNFGCRVVVQSTTRSPAVVSDQAGYPLRRALEFPSPDDPSRLSRLYNVVDPQPEVGDTPGYDHIVVLAEATTASQCQPLMDALRPYAGRSCILPFFSPSDGA